MQILDTDILVDLLRKHPPAVAWFASLTTPPALTGFVVMELLQGCRNSAEVRAVERLVAGLSVVWPSDADCNEAMSAFGRRHLTSRLGLLDALVAACALGHRATLLTFNVKHYAAVPDLLLEQPYVR